MSDALNIDTASWPGTLVDHVTLHGLLGLLMSLTVFELPEDVDTALDNLQEFHAGIDGSYTAVTVCWLVEYLAKLGRMAQDYSASNRVCGEIVTVVAELRLLIQEVASR